MDLSKVTRADLNRFVEEEAAKLSKSSVSDRDMIIETHVRMKILFGNGSGGWCDQHSKRIRRMELLLASCAGAYLVIMAVTKVILPDIIAKLGK